MVNLSLLDKLFHDKDTAVDINIAEIFYSRNFDAAKLFVYYRSETNRSNTILLPEEYIHPELELKEVKLNENIKIDDLEKILVQLGYDRVEQIFSTKQFLRRGDVFTISTEVNELCYRIDFFGDSVEKISLIDSVSLRFIKNLKNAVFLNITPEISSFSPVIYGSYDNYNAKPVIYTSQKLNLPESFDAEEKEFKTESIPLFHKNFKLFETFLRDYSEYKVYYTGHYWEALPEDFRNNSLTKLIQIELPLTLAQGFVHNRSKSIVLTDHEILSTLNLFNAKRARKSKFEKLFDGEINIGDYVVHEAHGIGSYKGIETRLVLGQVHEYVVIEYEGEDKLLIPFTQLARISKYVSSDNSVPKVTKLGTAEWASIQRRLKKDIEDIAKELLEVYAKKSMVKGIEFASDNKEQEKFESAWEFELTEDQLRTLNEVKSDMESPRPMDRLIIGDVGFGKTEIAIRAAFKAVQSGKQVLVLAPTTVLVTQLYNVFTKRMKDFALKIARVSRFDGAEANKRNIELANNGGIDILVGTHRLLSKDVELPKLGLLIIDEEQRFGVKQKEKIRKLRADIDLLSMSATPIPRTLQMALTGIKDISIIATPPMGRLPVHNEVIFDDEIAEKVQWELERQGQVYIVHNKVQDIDTFAAKLLQNLPEGTKIAIGHGQMTGQKLEKVMYDFLMKEFDVLVATTIIENGLDIPSVNTIIVDDAQNFGLAQLYQLRGRVGRSKVQGYCYLVLPKTREFIQLHKNPNMELRNLAKLLEENKIEDRWVTPDAVSRIEAILDNQALGAGFKIASRDLEIRGSGNILGTEQSGQINAVGYEMYIRLLEQEIERIRELNNSVTQ